jgi:hypothetical protein
MAAIHPVDHLRADDRGPLGNQLSIPRELDAASVGAADYPVAAVPGPSPVPAGVATIATVETIAAVAEE